MSKIAEHLVRKMPEQLNAKEWFSAVKVGFQQDIVTFLLRAYGGLLIATVVFILLQGFHVKGFTLDPAFLQWLGGATVGEIGGLLLLTIRVAFRK